MKFTDIKKNNRGSAMIIVALSFATLLDFLALVADVGLVAIEKEKLQNAIDSASLLSWP